MTITYSQVSDYFRTTMNRDFFYMMIGETLGAGECRIVFEHIHRPDLVLKFEPNAQSFQNIAEWDFWNDNKDTKKIARWLAPCEFISPCGIILAQKKTTKPDRVDYPKKLPRFLTDLKRTNYGMLDGHLVAHDYGLYNVETPTQLRVAKWWSPSNS